MRYLKSVHLFELIELSLQNPAKLNLGWQKREGIIDQYYEQPLLIMIRQN